ncbi:type I-C CRISPR-associated protein Cas7/Csd2 [Babesia caballi]|uniref:Type I-C CRISPR-associated protein Cas7/Csd2 n=1 Tax=Babesia caballi TaxID=5871 RepID=A0AAV4M3H8_BABCB|nr:type I-C CRISPR-associated protein Cas7/Csd2 [Babesia caballi]
MPTHLVQCRALPQSLLPLDFPLAPLLHLDLRGRAGGRHCVVQNDRQADLRRKRQVNRPAEPPVIHFARLPDHGNARPALPVRDGPVGRPQSEAAAVRAELDRRLVQGKAPTQQRVRAAPLLRLRAPSGQARPLDLYRHILVIRDGMQPLRVW